jgi:hypothetical protein
VLLLREKIHALQQHHRDERFIDPEKARHHRELNHLPPVINPDHPQAQKVALIGDENPAADPPDLTAPEAVRAVQDPRVVLLEADVLQDQVQKDPVAAPDLLPESSYRRGMIKIIVIFLSSVVFITGCFTIIKHPVIHDEDNPDLSYNIYFSDDCNSCHSSALQNNTPNLDYINSSPRWNYFYEFPWWQRHQFYTSPSVSQDSSGNGGLPTTSARPRFPGRGSSGQTGMPGSVSNPSSGSGNTPRITGGNSSATSKTTTENDNANDQNSSKVRESSRSSQKDKNETGKKDRPKRKQ